ncbi:MAG: MoaD/ThiS family protein [Gemmatimonadales bacterium]
MAITVHLPSLLARHAAGVRTHLVGGATVAEALTNLTRDFPELDRRISEATAARTQFVLVYLNDEDVRHHGGWTAPLRDGDEISLVSAIAGG